MRFRRIAVLAVVASLAAATPAAAHGGPHIQLQFRGQAIVPTGTQFQSTLVGGLSSIAYDARRGDYYILSDDQVGARFYTARIDVADGRLTDGDVHFTGVTTLLAPDGK